SDLENSLVVSVRDVQIPARIQPDTGWAVEARARRRPAIAHEGGAAIARHGGDDPCRRGNLANSVVATIRDVEIPARIQRDTAWVDEARACRRTAIAREGGVAIARHGGDAPCCRSDLANSLVAPVRDVEIPARIQRHAVWVAESRARRRPAIAREGGVAIARHGRDDSRRRS